MDKAKYLKYFRGLYWNFTFLRPLLAGIYDTIFPSAMKFSGLGYTIWFVKNLGLKNFLKNIDVFFSQNIGGGFALMIAVTMLIKKKFSY